MKPVDVYQINPAHDEVISVRSDMRLRDLPENACCSRWRDMGERVTVHGLGITVMRFNFCPTCGRRLK